MKALYRLTVVVENNTVIPKLEKDENLKMFINEIAKNIRCMDTALNITANLENRIYDVIRCFNRDYSTALINKTEGKANG